MLCGLCHPYSAQLYERLDTSDGLTMTNDFCDEFFSACSSELDLPSDYCDIHTGGDTDQYWAYPLVLDGEFYVKGVCKHRAYGVFKRCADVYFGDTTII